jgi:hypothetical protein
MNISNSKLQHPSSREFSSVKLQIRSLAEPRILLMFGVWSFFGAWLLVLGASISIGA